MNFTGIASWIFLTYDVHLYLRDVFGLNTDWMVNGETGSGNCIASTPCMV